jgi:peptidoglycan/LPS O-acetylase OafA/YrhL
MSHASNRIPSLDGLRCIAVSLVLFSHLLGTTGFLHPPKTSWPYEFGNLGVKVFFVISGYLITNLLITELERTNKIHLGKFYFRRTFRIFLPFYFMIGVLILLGAAGLASITTKDVLHAVTYTSNYYSARSWSVGHTWSLGVEEQFYLLWPAVLVFMGRRRGFHAAAAVLLICPIIRLAYWHVYRLDGIGYRFETCADAIATGCLLAGAHEWLQGQSLYKRLLESKIFLAVPAIVLFADTFYGHPTVYLLISHSIMNIGIALCLDWCVTHHTGFVGRVLNSRPLVYMGVISYSLYLWQQVFFNRYSALAMNGFPVNVGLVAVAALGSYYLIELPSLRLRQRFERNIFFDSKVQTAPVSPSKTVLPERAI